MEDSPIITLENVNDIQHHLSLVERARVYGSNRRPYYHLLKELRIQLSDGGVITIPKGFEWDLSSVPRFLWGILPPDGGWEFASLIHDFLYITKVRSRKFSDKEMLLWSQAMNSTRNKLSGKNLDNRVRYLAVRLFGGFVWNNGKKVVEGNEQPLNEGLDYEPGDVVRNTEEYTKSSVLLRYLGVENELHLYNQIAGPETYEAFSDGRIPFLSKQPFWKQYITERV